MASAENRKLWFVFVAAFIATALVVLVVAARAEAIVLPPVNADQTIRDEPGSIHQIGTIDVPDGLVGQTCQVTATAANNKSVHPNSDIIVQSGELQAVLPDLEREADTTISETAALEVGTSATVSVRLGPDGVFSGGLTVVTMDCPEPPPTTTTTPPHSTPNLGCTDFVTNIEQGGCSESPPTPVSGPTPTAEPPALSTLPHTGPPEWLPLAGLAALIVALGAVALRVGRNGSVR